MEEDAPHEECNIYLAHPRDMGKCVWKAAYIMQLYLILKNDVVLVLLSTIFLTFFQRIRAMMEITALVRIVCILYTLAR